MEINTGMGQALLLASASLRRTLVPHNTNQHFYGTPLQAAALHAIIEQHKIQHHKLSVVF